MARIFGLAVALAGVVGGAALADGWILLKGADIRTALERRILRYVDGSEQFFNYGGLTSYRIGWPNEGHWKVVKDQYCAQWPPSRAWQCFDVAQSTDGKAVRFMDTRGGIFEAHYLEN